MVIDFYSFLPFSVPILRIPFIEKNESVKLE